MDGRPTLGARHDTRRGGECVVRFDDMDVLNAVAFAGPDDGRGIVRLIDVFQDDGQVAGPVREGPVDDLLPMVGQVLG